LAIGAMAVMGAGLAIGFAGRRRRGLLTDDGSSQDGAIGGKRDGDE
jgi:hypothetical protein